MQESAEIALAWAKKCLTEGEWDSRTADGARVNAMESIAWSLIGILQASLEGKETTISGTLEKAGFVNLNQR